MSVFKKIQRMLSGFPVFFTEEERLVLKSFLEKEGYTFKLSYSEIESLRSSQFRAWVNEQGEVVYKDDDRASGVIAVVGVEKFEQLIRVSQEAGNAFKTPRIGSNDNSRGRGIQTGFADSLAFIATGERRFVEKLNIRIWLGYRRRPEAGKTLKTYAARYNGGGVKFPKKPKDFASITPGSFEMALEKMLNIQI